MNKKNININILLIIEKFIMSSLISIAIGVGVGLNYLLISKSRLIFIISEFVIGGVL